MPRNTHNQRGIKSHHRKTRGGLRRTKPSRAKRFPMRRS